MGGLLKERKHGCLLRVSGGKIDKRRFATPWEGLSSTDSSWFEERS